MPHVLGLVELFYNYTLNFFNLASLISLLLSN
ncbi:hypothetical protein VIBNIFTn2_210168 [Vibrio nigripulchritudo FTn2]|nr:hypothetical protein VIBNIAM115_1260039 [Vibrio nigripulchritudo AM115]CCN41917.1 hypothetical protein VIBNIFTn2_210168 [Vibrio nigripulchritudo FTn2]